MQLWRRNLLRSGLFSLLWFLTCWGSACESDMKLFLDNSNNVSSCGMLCRASHETDCWLASSCLLIWPIQLRIYVILPFAYAVNQYCSQDPYWFPLGRFYLWDNLTSCGPILFWRRSCFAAFSKHPITKSFFLFASDIENLLAHQSCDLRPFRASEQQLWLKHELIQFLTTQRKP